MITFEEYNLLEAYISSDNFKILLEKNLGPKFFSNRISKFSEPI